MIGVRNYPDGGSFKEFYYSDGSTYSVDSKGYQDSNYTTTKMKLDEAQVKLVKLRYHTDAIVYAMEFFDKTNKSIFKVGFYDSPNDPNWKYHDIALADDERIVGIKSGARTNTAGQHYDL